MLTFKQVKTQWLVGVYPMAFSFIYFFKRLARLSRLRLARLSSGLDGNAENPTWGSPLHCYFGTHCCGFQEMLWLFLRFFFFFFWHWFSNSRFIAFMSPPIYSGCTHLVKPKKKQKTQKTTRFHRCSARHLHIWHVSRCSGFKRLHVCAVNPANECE